MSWAPPTQGWGTFRCLGQEATHAGVLVSKLEKPYLSWSKKIEICHLQHFLAAVLMDSTSHWHQPLRRWNKLLGQIILAFSILGFLLNMMMKGFNNCHDNSPIRIDFILVWTMGPHPWFILKWWIMGRFELGVLEGSPSVGYSGGLKIPLVSSQCPRIFVV